MSHPIIDAHQHVWDLERARYDWLGPDAAPLDRSIGLDESLPEQRAAGVTATVLVQAADNAEDTAVMLDTAAEHAEVVAVVAYAPLGDPAGTAAAIESWSGDDLIVGVRNLIHDMPDPDWLLRPEVDESLGLLERAGLAFDVVAVLPRHLEHVPVLAERHPDLRLVVDHLSKPPIGVDADGRGDAGWPGDAGGPADAGERWPRGSWQRMLGEAAAYPNVSAKVSGLYSATADPAAWTTDLIRPYVEHAFDVFGADRLMYGGDWPISVLAGGYTRVWRGLTPLFDGLSVADREAVLGGTAANIYGISAERLSRAEAASRAAIAHDPLASGVADREVVGR